MTKKIIEVSYGIASSYDEYIEINRFLPEDLRKKVLQHELKHDNKSYTKNDFMTDFNSSNSYFKKSFIFALKNPSALVGFLPLMYSYYFKQLTYNISSLPPFFYFGVIFSLFWWLTLKVNILYPIIIYIGIVIGLNLILMGLTHYILKRKYCLDY